MALKLFIVMQLNSCILGKLSIMTIGALTEAKLRQSSSFSSVPSSRTPSGASLFIMPLRDGSWSREATISESEQFWRRHSISTASMMELTKPGLPSTSMECSLYLTNRSLVCLSAGAGRFAVDCSPEE